MINVTCLKDDLFGECLIGGPQSKLQRKEKDEKLTIIMNESYKLYIYSIHVCLMALKQAFVGQGYVLPVL